MSLPATIGVTRLSDSASITYGDKDTEGDKTTYYAPSPNGDLAGRLKLIYEHQVTKQGIARTVITSIRPILNATTGRYDTYRKIVSAINRDEVDAIVDVTDDYKMHLDAMGVPGTDAQAIAAIAQLN